MIGKITLDNPQFAGNVRWKSHSVSRSRQPRRTFRPAFTSDVIKQTVIKQYRTKRPPAPRPVVDPINKTIQLPAEVLQVAPIDRIIDNRFQQELDQSVPEQDYLPPPPQIPSHQQSVGDLADKLSRQTKTARRNARMAINSSKFRAKNTIQKILSRSRMNSIKGRDLSIYAMATVVFVFGMVIVVDGYMTNRAVKEEVLGTAVSNSADAYLGQGEAVPNETSTDSAEGAYGSESAPTLQQLSAHTVGLNEGRYLRIPKINVYSRVFEVGKTDTGAVDAPWGIHNVGWYSGSRNFDSTAGAAFLVGHVHGKIAKGVFYDLNKLVKGDIIEVERGDGTILKFKVVSTVSYRVGEVDMSKAMAPVNPERLGLNLMTCGGKYDRVEQQYTERLLVRAEHFETNF